MDGAVATTDPYAELIGRVKESAILGSCSAVLGWDERTFMPPAAAATRAGQVALLARLGHEMYTHPRVGELLDGLRTSSLPDDQSANVREIRRTYDRAVKVPKSLVEELARVTSQAQGVWQKAKADNDFAAFRPWLEHIVALKRREIDCVGYDDSPYDALLDEYEPGARAVDLKCLFAELATGLGLLAAEIADLTPPTSGELWQRDFPVVAQESLCREVAAAAGFDFNAGRLDTTAHPFCSGIGPGDCRILTRYHPNRPLESFFGTLHEAGHGLYEQGLPAEHHGTPLGVAASFGIHESQSRLWENQVGRSREFWRHYYPVFLRSFGPALDGVSETQFWRLANQVRPSLIRIDADEVTYNLHIILRFGLELALLTGEVKVADLPGAWNDRFKSLFGLDVPDDTRGCLQDIHWSFGGFGYFPTYTLGNLYAAQFMEAAGRDLPNLWGDIGRGEFRGLTAWLRETIHRHGQRYRPPELCQRVTGRPLSHAPFLDYLRKKFLGGST